MYGGSSIHQAETISHCLTWYFRSLTISFIYNKYKYRVENWDIWVMDISDHSPIYMSLQLSKEIKTTMWRLNAHLLNGNMEEELTKEINIYIKGRIIMESFPHPHCGIRLRQ